MGVVVPKARVLDDTLDDDLMRRRRVEGQRGHGVGELGVLCSTRKGRRVFVLSHHGVHLRR